MHVDAPLPLLIACHCFSISFGRDYIIRRIPYLQTNFFHINCHIESAFSFSCCPIVLLVRSQPTAAGKMANRVFPFCAFSVIFFLFLVIDSSWARPPKRTINPTFDIQNFNSTQLIKTVREMAVCGGNIQKKLTE